MLTAREHVRSPNLNTQLLELLIHISGIHHPPVPFLLTWYHLVHCVNLVELLRADPLLLRHQLVLEQRDLRDRATPGAKTCPTPSLVSTRSWTSSSTTSRL